MRGLRPRRRRRSRHGTLATAGFVSGVVAGLVLWSVQMRRCRRDLFSASPVKRLAALGHLSGDAGVDSVHLLTEYVRWERQPMLRQRGERLLQRVKSRLV